MADDNVISAKVVIDAEGVAPAFTAAGVSVDDWGEIVESVAPKLDKFTASEVELVEAAKPIPGVMQNLISWFREMGSAAVESSSEIRASSAESAEAVARFAERTRISATGVTSSFALIGGALAGVAIVGVLGEMLDKTKETIIETEHLSSATGIEVKTIIELKDAMQAVGAPSENLQQSLSRMARAIEAAHNPTSKQAEAFRELGVDIDAARESGNVYDNVLQQIAAHLGNSTRNTQDMAAMQTVAGRNVVGLTAFLKGQGEELDANMAKHRDHAEAIEAAVPAAKKLQEEEAHLSELWRTMLADVFPGIITAFKTIETVVRAVLLPMQLLVDIALEVGTLFYQTFEGIGAAMIALADGHISLAVNIIKDRNKSMQETVAFYTNEMVEDTKSAFKKISDIWAAPLPEPKPSGETNTEPKDKDKQLQIQAKELEGKMAHEVAMLELEKKRYEDQERIGEISAEKNLSRLIQNNNEIVSVQKKYIDELIALYASDPNSAVKVAELHNKRVEEVDKGLSNELALKVHALEAEKKLSEEQEREYQKLQAAITEMAVKAAAKQEEVLKHLASEGQTTYERQQQDAIKAEDAKTKAVEQHMTRVAELYRRDVELQYSLGLLTLAQRDAMLNKSFEDEATGQQKTLDKQLAALDAHNELYYSKRAALVQKILDLSVSGQDTKELERELSQLDSFNASYLSKRQALLDQLQAMNDKRIAQEQTADEQHLKKMAESFKSFIDTVGTAFSQNVMGWIKGTQSFQQAFANMGSQILAGWIQDLVTMGVKFAEHKALEIALNATGNAAKATSDTAADTEAVVADKAASSQMIVSAAAVGAANAYAATAIIPFVGPEIAPGVAAATGAAIMAFEGVNFAEQGALVPNDQLMFLHKNEMVLPAPLSAGVQKMVDGNSSGGNDGGGDTHFHFNPNIQVLDSSGVDKVLQDHQRTFIRHLQSWSKSGHLGRN